MNNRILRILRGTSGHYIPIKPDILPLNDFVIGTSAVFPFMSNNKDFVVVAEDDAFTLANVNVGDAMLLERTGICVNPYDFKFAHIFV